MDRYQEEKIKAMAEQQAQSQCGASIGGLNQCCDTPRRDIRDRMREKLRAAERQASKTSSLAELLRLLEKNPDVAAILTLMEDM